MAIVSLSSGAGVPLRATSAIDVTVVRVPHGGLQPEVVVDGRGTLHMIYFAGDPHAGDLFYVRSTDSGAIFSAPIRVNGGEGSAIAAGTIRGGQIAVGRGGRVHVSWNGSSRASPPGAVNPRTGRSGPGMLYARSNERGTTFEPQRNLMQRSYLLDGGGSIAADAAGGVYVAWHAAAVAAPSESEGDRRVWIARSKDDGRTFAAEDPVWTEPTGACGCCGLRLFASRANTLYLLYRSAARVIDRDVYLLASTDRGRTFRGSRVHEWEIGACPMTSMSFAEQRSRTLAAWETAGQVYFGAIDPASPRVPAPRAPTPGPTGRKHPRLAINGRGETLLVWTEGTAWARGGAVGWQIFNDAGEPAGRTQARPGVPVWSFAAAVARPDGGFTIFY